MHSELGNADIARGQGDFGVGDIAKGATAAEVASVGVFLSGDARERGKLLN